MTGFISSKVSLILHRQHLLLCIKYTYTVYNYHPINQTSQCTGRNSNCLNFYQCSPLLPFSPPFKPATRYARWMLADSCFHSHSIVKYISAYRKMNTKYIPPRLSMFKFSSYCTSAFCSVIGLCVQGAELIK